MQVRVADDIGDPYLKCEWERLEQECVAFPQNTYHWCHTWWKHLAGRRKLHVVIAQDDEGRATGIAPLCIERHLGVRVLRSCPINFGDFYTFLVRPGDTADATYEALLGYVTSNTQWRWVRIEKVREMDPLVPAMERHYYAKRKMTGCVVIDYSGLDWSGYLSQLAWKQRQNIRKKYKEIRGTYDTVLDVTTTAAAYAPLYEEMVAMHERRWQDDYRTAKGPKEITCWREAIEGQFQKGSMWYCRLILDGRTVAYHLGFVHRDVFYDWHMGYDPQYAKHGVGSMTLAFMIEQFMDRRIGKVHLMAGEYDWKIRLSPGRQIETIWMLTAPSQNLASHMLNWYHHRLRDRLRTIYHCMARVRAMRSVLRAAIGVGEVVTRRR